METKDVAQMEIDIEDIVLGSNCRSRMNKGKFDELVLSVKKVGILEPALVRWGAKGEFILIAGYRRLTAAKSAGLKVIPVRVLDVDENRAAEIQALENIHREDLSPMDEARAFNNLLNLGSHTVETLADQVDKSVQYIYRSLRLLDLPAKAIKALEEGIISTGHAHQILRAPKENAEALVHYATTTMEWQKRIPTVDELRQYIEKRIEKDLASAPFPKDVPFGEQVACSTCPFNTGNQNTLFDGATKGHCTNPGCFNKKTAAYYKSLQNAGAAKFAGLKFLGSGTDNGYSSAPMQIKGACVVEKVDEKIKKAMEAKPDQFAFGIVKPSRWGGQKKARVVLLCKEPKLVGLTARKQESSYREPTPEERARDEFVQQEVEIGVYGLAIEKLVFDKDDVLGLLQEGWDQPWQRRRITPLMKAAAIQIADETDQPFPSAALEKKSRESLIQLLLLSLLNSNGNEIHGLLDQKKIKVQEFVKKIEAEALKRWAEKSSKAA